MFENFVRQLRDDMRKVPERTNAAGWLFGTVTAADPLAVLLESGLEIPSSALALSPFASAWEANANENGKSADGWFDFKHKHRIINQKTEKTVLTGLVASPTISGSAQVTDTAGHTHIINDQETDWALLKVKMWRGLQKGDKVLLSRVQGGQMFVVWFRVTFLDNGKEKADSETESVVIKEPTAGTAPTPTKTATVAATCPALVAMLPPPASVYFSGVHYDVVSGEPDGTTCSGVLILGVGSVTLEPGYWTVSCAYNGTGYASDRVFVPFGGTVEATLS